MPDEERKTRKISLQITDVGHMEGSEGGQGDELLEHVEFRMRAAKCAARVKKSIDAGFGVTHERLQEAGDADAPTIDRSLIVRLSRVSMKMQRQLGDRLLIPDCHERTPRRPQSAMSAPESTPTGIAYSLLALRFIISTLLKGDFIGNLLGKVTRLSR